MYNEYKVNRKGIISKKASSKVYFNGYASIFNVPDLHNDIIINTAFDTMKNQQNDLEYKFLLQHDYQKPIGIVNKIDIDEIGLFVHGYIVDSNFDGSNAVSLIENNVLTQLSVGILIQESKIIREYRYLTKLILQEISLVTFPANNLTSIKIIGYE